MNKDQQLTQVQDHRGWASGIKATLRGIFGTDMEMHLRSVSHQELEHAKQEVKRMSAGAEVLLDALDYTSPQDDVQIALEAIVKDL